MRADRQADRQRNIEGQASVDSAVQLQHISLFCTSGNFGEELTLNIIPTQKYIGIYWKI